MASRKDESGRFQFHPHIAAGAIPAAWAVPVLAGFLVVAGSPAMLGAGQDREAPASWEERQSSIADRRAHRVSSGLWDRRGGLRPSPGPMLEHLKLLSATKRLSGHLAIYVMDREGYAATQAPGLAMPSPLPGQAARQAVESGQFRIEWLFAGPNRDTLCFTSPVPDREGRPMHAALAALGDREAFGTSLDYRGVEVTAATRRIPASGWEMASKIDLRAALAGSYRELRPGAAAAVMLVLAFGGWMFGYRRGVRARPQKSHEEESRRLFESTPDGLVILDSGRRIVFVNSHMERLFGCSREELKGREFSFLVPRADLTRFR